MARNKLHEFFEHCLHEAPRDATFKPAPEIKPVASSETDLDAADPETELPPTQDVAPMDVAELDFFAKNAQSAVAKFSDLANEGFDSSALDQFAGALDQLVAQMYQSVQDPSDRQDFEVEAQKCAGDFSKDLAKLFERVLKLKAYGNTY